MKGGDRQNGGAGCARQSPLDNWGGEAGRGSVRRSVAVVPVIAFAFLLAWANMAGTQAPLSRDADLSNSALKAEGRGAARPSRLLVLGVSNKRVQGSDFHLGVFLQAIWFDRQE